MSLANNADLVLAEAWPVVLDEVQYARAIEQDLAGRLGPTGFEFVIYAQNGRFRLAKDCEEQLDAEVAFIMPIVRADGATADVLAWIPESDKFATLLGEVGTLGLGAIWAARLDPPVVHESVRAWLTADDTGLFVLDPRLAAVELEGVTMAAPDKDAALRLRAKLAPYCTRAPKIVVPRSNVRRAG